jgi:hypothetical protein
MGADQAERNQKWWDKALVTGERMARWMRGVMPRTQEEPVAARVVDLQPVAA